MLGTSPQAVYDAALLVQEPSVWNHLTNHFIVPTMPPTSPRKTQLIPNSTSCLANGVSMDEIPVHSEHTGGLPPALKSTQQVRHKSSQRKESRGLTLGFTTFMNAPLTKASSRSCLVTFWASRNFKLGSLCRTKHLEENSQRQLRKTGVMDSKVHAIYLMFRKLYH